jgi:hypothetical protein
MATTSWAVSPHFPSRIDLFIKSIQNHRLEYLTSTKRAKHGRFICTSCLTRPSQLTKRNESAPVRAERDVNTTNALECS